MKQTENQYKYISKSYSLEELLNGSLIFKIHYDFFCELRDIQEEYSYPLDMLINTDKRIFEQRFNDFLNIVSLFLYNENTFRETIKIYEEKATKDDLFIYMTNVLIHTLNHFELNKILIEKISKIFNNSRSILNKESDLLCQDENNEKFKASNKKHDKKVKNTVEKLFKEIEKLSRNDFDEIPLFFDVTQSNEKNRITEIFATLSKRIISPKFIQTQKLEPTLIDKIFKDDGLKIFNHIQNTYSDKKNLAFFSYLYFFLQSKMKLQVYSNDSTDFRTFVLSEFTELKRFSRIIPPNPDSSKTKDRIENTFNELLKSYSDTN